MPGSTQIHNFLFLDTTEVRTDLTNLTLLIPEKEDAERGAIAAAWRALGGCVLRIGRFWEPPQLPYGIRVYGDHVFCLVLAQKLDLKLISPADDLLLQLDPQWINRKLHRTTLDQMRSIAFPCFAKPLVQKVFRARVFDSPFELEEECRQLPSQTGVLYGEVVRFSCEVRAFVNHGKYCTLSLYEGEGDIEDAKVFINSFLDKYSHKLPVTFVIDLGYIEGRGWSIIEFNSTWGAGLNGCDAKEAVKCIAVATQEE